MGRKSCRQQVVTKTIYYVLGYERAHSLLNLAPHVLSCSWPSFVGRTAQASRKDRTTLGAHLHTFALPAAAPEKVRESAVNWLRAKGFVESAEATLFPFEEDFDRGLVLASNGQWTTVAYSHWHTEGERLAY